MRSFIMLAPNVKAFLGHELAEEVLTLIEERWPNHHAVVLTGKQLVSLGEPWVTSILEKPMGVLAKAPCIPEDPGIHLKACIRAVANKLALVLRCDEHGSAEDGSAGRQFREELTKALDARCKRAGDRQVRIQKTRAQLKAQVKKRAGRRRTRMKASREGKT